MQVKDILRDCLKKLNHADFLDKDNPTDEETALLNRLLDCLNLIYQEIVTDYFPLSAQERVQLNGSLLKYSTLEYRLIKPVKLEINGKNIAFTALPSGIECQETGEATLTYHYLPEALTVESQIDDYRLTGGLLSNGVLGEYYFLDSVFDMAQAYDAKFRSDLSWAAVKGREIKIKARRWGI
jgi:hypothetical protein